MNTHEKTGNAGTFPVIFLIIKISARNTSVNKQSNYKYMKTRPIMDGFRKNNVNYWVFREIRSIIPHL